MNDTLYEQFLSSKQLIVKPSGFGVDRSALNPKLFDYQADIVRWSLGRGKAAIFADCGLGKGPMLLDWSTQVAEYTRGQVLIIAPLAVSQQLVREGTKFGVDVTLCESQADATGEICTTNYQKLHHFDPRKFSAVVCDESSIMKHHDAQTRKQLVEFTQGIDYLLCCTATPSPNDHMELAGHSEHFRIMSKSEMLATWFVHDGGIRAMQPGHTTSQEWRLKGHAQDEFWKWVSSWAVMLRKPSDLGYSDDGFTLPPLHIHKHVVDGNAPMEGYLFPVEARTLTERRKARKSSLSERVNLCAEMVNASTEPWLLWCNFNNEGDALAKSIPDAVQVAGSDTDDHKARSMLDFADGNIRVLISKPSICGFGMNFQVCNNTTFVGLSDSYEQYYQALKRIHRYGQQNDVNCHIIISEQETAVLRNIQRKEQEALRMSEEMVKHMQVHNTADVHGTSRMTIEYNALQEMILPAWLREEVFV